MLKNKIFLPLLILKNLLYIFQQEEYEIQPFLNWIKNNKVRTNLEQKQKLVWTNKAKLIFGLSIILFLFFLGIAFYYITLFYQMLICIFLIILYFLLLPHYYLILSSLIIKPFEIVIKHFVILRAQKKLKKHPHLKIIGITGSYGKTSVKDFLATLLVTKYKVLKTPENINTPLGISALIQKEDLSKYEIFLVEMGAYRSGDIKKICQLVRPTIGILTGINESHLERFGTLKNTIKTKFELIESLPPEGMAILNKDDENVKNNYTDFGNCRKKTYSHQSAENILISENGIAFDLQPDLKIKAKILGKHNITNLMGAIFTAQELGLSNTEIQTGSQKIVPIKHRLEPVYNPNGIIVIDDSYNGNPTGVKAAIEVLSEFKNYRKIFIPPGLVELGDTKAEIHIEIGKLLTEVCDLVILIRNSNTPFFLTGLQQAGWGIDENETRLKVFDTSQEAHQALPNILKKGDVILFQNDWTDNYM